MCGIAGIVSQDKRRIRPKDLKLMGESMLHRGPDDEGFLNLDNVGLAHKRLSIIDLVTGHQPMCNEDGNIWIVYNGEIYNYIELRSELIGRGHIFKTHSDTEVIIHLYEEYGEKALLKLNGMFAFTIYDKRQDIIFAARDYFGIKPYYYIFNQDEFIFASEIKAILKIRQSYRKEDISAIQDYITFQFCLGEKTFFKNIKKLLPGHYLILKNISRKPKLSIYKYWDLAFKIDTRHKEDYFIDNLVALFEDAVRLQLRSDVPLGCHLSGGLDSTIVTCLASRLLHSKVKTFTGTFKDSPEYDETKYAKIVSDYTKSQYFETRPTAEDFQKNIARIIYMMDEPAAGPGIFPQFFVSRLASQKVKVVLGGQGGDEIFGGYARYSVAYFEESLGKSTKESLLRKLPVLKGYMPLIESFWGKRVSRDKEKIYFNLIDRGKDAHNLFSGDLLRMNKKYDTLASFQELFNSLKTDSFLNKMINFDLKTLLPALLHVEDRTSMNFSLESRVPFLDNRIAELAATLPPRLKLKEGTSKYIVRKAVKNLVPGEILARKDKMGFPVPTYEWFKGELNDFVKEILLGRSAKARGIYNLNGIKEAIDKEKKFDRQIWGLLCLELWFREFIDR